MASDDEDGALTEKEWRAMRRRMTSLQFEPVPETPELLPRSFYGDDDETDAVTATQTGLVSRDSRDGEGEHSRESIADVESVAASSRTIALNAVDAVDTVDAADAAPSTWTPQRDDLASVAFSSPAKSTLPLTTASLKSSKRRSVTSPVKKPRRSGALVPQDRDDRSVAPLELTDLDATITSAHDQLRLAILRAVEDTTTRHQRDATLERRKLEAVHTTRVAMLQSQLDELLAQRHAQQQQVHDAMQTLERVTRLMMKWKERERARWRAPHSLHACFEAWKVRWQHKKHTHAQQRVACQFEKHQSQQLVLQQWRLTTQQNAFEKKLQTQRDNHSRALEATKKEYEAQLEHMRVELQAAKASATVAQHGREQLEGDLRQVFLRGVSAMNIEALTLFKTNHQAQQARLSERRPLDHSALQQQVQPQQPQDLHDSDDGLDSHAIHGASTAATGGESSEELPSEERMVPIKSPTDMAMDPVRERLQSLRPTSTTSEPLDPTVHAVMPSSIVANRLLKHAGSSEIVSPSAQPFTDNRLEPSLPPPPPTAALHGLRSAELVEAHQRLLHATAASVSSTSTSPSKLLSSRTLSPAQQRLKAQSSMTFNVEMELMRSSVAASAALSARDVVFTDEACLVTVVGVRTKNQVASGAGSCRPKEKASIGSYFCLLSLGRSLIEYEYRMVSRPTSAPRTRPAPVATSTGRTAPPLQQAPLEYEQHGEAYVTLMDEENDEDDDDEIDLDSYEAYLADIQRKAQARPQSARTLRPYPTESPEFYMVTTTNPVAPLDVRSMTNPQPPQAQPVPPSGNKPSVQRVPVRPASARPRMASGDDTASRAPQTARPFSAAASNGALRRMRHVPVGNSSGEPLSAHVRAAYSDIAGRGGGGGGNTTTSHTAASVIQTRHRVFQDAELQHEYHRLVDVVADLRTVVQHEQTQRVKAMARVRRLEEIVVLKDKKIDALLRGQSHGLHTTQAGGCADVHATAHLQREMAQRERQHHAMMQKLRYKLAQQTQLVASYEETMQTLRASLKSTRLLEMEHEIEQLLIETGALNEALAAQGDDVQFYARQLAEFQAGDAHWRTQLAKCHHELKRSDHERRKLEHETLFLKASIEQLEHKLALEQKKRVYDQVIAARSERTPRKSPLGKSPRGLASSPLALSSPATSSPRIVLAEHETAALAEVLAEMRTMRGSPPSSTKTDKSSPLKQRRSTPMPTHKQPPSPTFSEERNANEEKEAKEVEKEEEAEKAEEHSANEAEVAKEVEEVGEEETKAPTMLEGGNHGDDELMDSQVPTILTKPKKQVRWHGDEEAGGLVDGEAIVNTGGESERPSREPDTDGATFKGRDESGFGDHGADRAATRDNIPNGGDQRIEQDLQDTDAIEPSSRRRDSPEPERLVQGALVVEGEISLGMEGTETELVDEGVDGNAETKAEAKTDAEADGPEGDNSTPSSVSPNASDADARPLEELPSAPSAIEQDNDFHCTDSSESSLPSERSGSPSSSGSLSLPSLIAREDAALMAAQAALETESADDADHADDTMPSPDPQLAYDSDFSDNESV